MFEQPGLVEEVSGIWAEGRGWNYMNFKVASNPNNFFIQEWTQAEGMPC